MITVICPVYNEENYIEMLLHFFVHAAPAEKELIIVDGGSTDHTRKIIEKWQKEHSNIILLDNPDKYVPYALNKAIAAAAGDPIIRLDAHTVYADNYFEKIIETFRDTEADIVGGPMRAFGKTPLQSAIATATSTSFGVGDSSFHDPSYKGYVDSVYLGAWRRKVFEDVGMFHTRMKRNQDDEFHYRAKSKGKTIYLNPEIKSLYYPRDSFKKLFSQYFQYGLFKPLVLKKVKSEIKLRHLIPAIFVCYLLAVPLLYFYISFLALLPLLLYCLSDAFFSFRSGKTILEKLLAFIVYPVLHIAYGSGFLMGLIRAPGRS